MSTTLGLDIGTNSIGWCLMEDGKRIQGIGVRIFPVGVKEDDFAKTGTEVSKNSARRTARTTRRSNYRYKLRRRELKKILLELEMMPTEKMILEITAPELFQLRKRALDNRIELKELGRVFLHLNQRRGFRSSKKDAKTEEAKKEKSEYLQNMNTMATRVKESGCRTIGEFFCNLFDANAEIENWHNAYEPIEKIRGQFVFRKLYEDEFDKIWGYQSAYYTAVLSAENKKRIKDNCIYYQRPLKSQKHLVGKCRFEPTKRVAPRSSFEFQEFRIWQTLSNIRLTFENRISEPLTLQEKQIIAEKLSTAQNISQAKLKEAIGFKKARLNDMPDKLPGNNTCAKLSTALGKSYFDSLTEKQKYKFWHTLFFATDEEWLYNYSVDKLRLNPEQAAAYAAIEPEPDYSNISVKAIRKILPYLKQGQDYAKACESAGYHHSYDEETDSKDRKLDEKITRNKYGKKDEIDELRNPIVQRALGETIKLVNAIIAEYGKPTKLRVELAREMKKPKKVREAIRYSANEKARLREKYVEFLRSKLSRNITKSDLQKFELWLELDFPGSELAKIKDEVDLEQFTKFAKRVKSTDLEKYKLYLECGRISPYTGKVISLKKLFSPEIEVEHIIPYSKFPDDSFINKTLAEHDFNKTKGNQTAMQYFEERPEEKEAFIDRIKHFSDGKQERFKMATVPEEFLNSQLTNNSYIATRARKLLKQVCRDVYITNGQVTSELRRQWELNKILNPDGQNEKSRDDHRHHAIDALVIANTNYRKIQELSLAGKFNLKPNNFSVPYRDFAVEAGQKIPAVLVSYRNKKKVVTTKANKYMHSNTKHSQKSHSLRGQLHEQTNYGRIFYKFTNTHRFVIRKPLGSITDKKHIEKIVDDGIRRTLLEHIEANGGNIKKALTIPVFMKSKDGKKKIPVKSVRMFDSAESMIQLKPGENSKLYVSSGNNYAFAIYEDKKSDKRDFETISFFNAVQRKLKAAPIIPQIKDGMPLQTFLRQNDMVVVYDQHPDEIDWNNHEYLSNHLYRFMKSDVNGNLIFGIHNLSRIKGDKDQKPIVLRKNYNTFKGIKVQITTTGRLALV